ncbi:transglycosylase domain-containing protein [Paenibacillus donghaensis]|uniref:Uncharacterized protein n=1 Tax=Paenibacillus donghaensis TaxID=414771 RepID=A0A2Z2KS80_9BACL|nr:PBP1A family penicillin-binding protein [Paenibacillus donghaensis]ASA24412.1 hypothetical protein B9T62_28880 [Paenibacillus donghaensis]
MSAGWSYRLLALIAGKLRRRKAQTLLYRICYRLFDLTVVVAILALAILLYVHQYGGIVVSRHPEKLKLAESSQILSADGTLLRTLPLPGSGYRLAAMLDEMPQLLLDTFLAVEDRRFYSHQGLDYRGILRAFVNNATRGSLSEGGSSITQQLARNLYLNREKSWLRKLNEAGVALELERRLSKDEILQLYLNQIYMGSGQYGVKAAAKRYFGVSDLKLLEIGQIAGLAGLPKGPSIYNPLDHPEQYRIRQKLVLKVMYQSGLISYAEMQQAARQTFQLPERERASTEGIGVSYLDAALREAARKTGITPEDLRTGGYTLVTAMNSGAQQVLEQVFADTSMFPPDGSDQQVEAVMTIMDHHTGEIIALMGGRDPQEGGLNRALLDARQPGSAFKPIIAYGPALESGRFTPESMLPDRKAAYGTYRPENLNGIYRGQLSMRTALQQSVNAPAVWLLQQLGLSNAREFASRLGIKLAPEDNNLAIALGGLHSGVSPLSMTQAYSVFASGGVYQEAHLVRRVTDKQGRTVYEHQSKRKQVVSQATAAGITAMLRSAVERGTGQKARMNLPVAGKTGTTQLDLPGVSSKANRDLWFVGYTPQWTAAVWMGFDRTDSHNYMTAGSGKAAALFAAVISRAAAQAGSSHE